MSITLIRFIRNPESTLRISSPLVRDARLCARPTMRINDHIRQTSPRKRAHLPSERKCVRPGMTPFPAATYQFYFFASPSESITLRSDSVTSATNFL